MVTNIHITDEHLTGPIPQQACLFKNLKELDLDGGSLTGTIPEFLTTCFPELNELDLSYNQVSRAPSTTDLQVQPVYCIVQVHIAAFWPSCQREALFS